MRALRFVTAVFAAAMMMAGVANAATYIQIKGVDGESTDNNGQPQIEVLSWSWGETNSGTFSKPPNSGIVNVTLKRGFTGRAALQSLYNDKREIPTLVLTTQERGKTVKYKLERCYIKSWSTSGDADDRPTEEVAFYYNKIAF